MKANDFIGYSGITQNEKADKLANEAEPFGKLQRVIWCIGRSEKESNKDRQRVTETSMVHGNARGERMEIWRGEKK